MHGMYGFGAVIWLPIMTIYLIKPFFGYQLYQLQDENYQAKLLYNSTIGRSLFDTKNRIRKQILG